MAKIWVVSEQRGRNIDAACKMIATAFVVLGGGWTIYTYNTTRGDSLKNAAIEARKPIFERQLDVCVSAVKLANMASTGDSKEAVAARVEYEALFRSTITVVADQNIYAPASNFSDCLLTAACKEGQLALKAHNLALGCSRSVGDMWGTILHSPAPAPVSNITIAIP